MDARHAVCGPVTWDGLGLCCPEPALQTLKAGPYQVVIRFLDARAGLLGDKVVDVLDDRLANPSQVDEVLFSLKVKVV